MADSEDSNTSADDDEYEDEEEENYKHLKKSNRESSESSEESSSGNDRTDDEDYNPSAKKSKKTSKTVSKKTFKKAKNIPDRIEHTEYTNLTQPQTTNPINNTILTRPTNSTKTLNLTIPMSKRVEKSTLPKQPMPTKEPKQPKPAKETKQPKQTNIDRWPWKYNELNVVKNIPFTGKSGISDDLQKRLDSIYEKRGGITEYDVLSTILDDDFWNIIVRETNLEANLQLNKNPPNLNPKSKSCSCWSDCTLDEIKTFFALIILMGQIRKPSLNLYWSKRKILSTPIFNEIMPINRFKLISKFIRFARRDHTNKNPLYRLQTQIDIICKKFETFYIPKKKVSIDESIIKFKGRLAMAHYIPNKASKNGFKFYKLCESDSAYCCKFFIADKKDERSKLKSQPVENISNLSKNNDDLVQVQGNVGESIVSTLGENIFNKGYVIYTDNFFTSPNLCKWLLERNTYSVGTSKNNRLNFPVKFKIKSQKKMKDKELKFASANNILALKFQDKRTTVHFLTTYSKQIDWITKNKKYKDIDRLECVDDYNKYMHGVDIHDQKLASFTIMRRHLKWYRKLFLYLLDMCILNASIIFHEYVQGKNSKNKFKARQLTQFRFDLVEQMLTSVKTIEYDKIVFKKNPLKFNSNRCFLVKLQPTEKKKNPTRKCAYCSSKKRRSETVYKCEYCGVALHKACFPLYHDENK